MADLQDIMVYLVKLLDHLLDADVSILGDLALHVGEPLAELLVLLIEHSPLVQLLTHLLPAQRQLQSKDMQIQLRASLCMLN